MITTGFITPVAADTVLGVYAGANYWQHDLVDNIDPGFDNINRNKNGNVFYIALEHPVPFLPNIKLQHNEIEGRVNGTASIIDIGGNINTVNAVISDDISHTDLILYYEILDNWLNFDLGLSVKKFNSVPFDDEGEWTPLIYGKGQVNLPFTGFSVYGSLETLSLNSNDVTDVEVGLNYESKIGLGGVVGYRALNVEYEFETNNRLISDSKADGFFIGINYHF